MSDRRPSRLEAVVNLAVRIAAGDLEARLNPSDAGDEVDALIASLNMLAEELASERRTRAEAEELLADELDTYDRAPALFWSLDGETLMVEKCNQTLADVLNLPKTSIVGRSVLALCAQEGRREAERLFRQRAVDVRANGGEVTLIAASGRPLTVAVSVSRIRVGDRERLRVVGKDVTAEKHLEAQLLRAQKMEAIGRLAGGVAHDFNNLLSIIMNAAEFVRETLVDNGLPADDALLITDAARRGGALTNDLLAFSRQRVVNPVPTDVRASVRDAERMIARLLGEDVRVVTEFTDQPVVCLIDPSQASQVLLNLAVNARDAMPAGGTLGLEVSRIELDSSDASERLDLSPGPHALITVSDTGIGMSAEVAARAFEPFFTTKPPGQGTGLGLAMCYGIIRQAGGRISIYSEVGRGTSVKIYLPLLEQPPQAEPEARAPVTPGHETILLVEDDDGIRALSHRILTGAGYRVLVASNGRHALEVAAAFEGDIALVVTDVMMPELGGRELAEVITKLRPSTRVLYVSGFTSNVIVAQGVLKPGFSFMPKPFTASVLLANVRRMIEQG